MKTNFSKNSKLAVIVAAVATTTITRTMAAEETEATVKMTATAARVQPSNSTKSKESTPTVMVSGKVAAGTTTVVVTRVGTAVREAAPTSRSRRR